MCEGSCNIKQYLIKTFHSKAAQKFAFIQEIWPKVETKLQCIENKEMSDKLIISPLNSNPNHRYGNTRKHL